MTNKQIEKRIRYVIFFPFQSAFSEPHFIHPGKSSVALILASTNPQYDKRLFSELQDKYMKIASSEHAQNILRTCCVHKLF